MWTIKRGNLSGYGDVYDVFNEDGIWVACFEYFYDASDFIHLKGGKRRVL